MKKILSILILLVIIFLSVDSGVCAKKARKNKQKKKAVEKKWMRPYEKHEFEGMPYRLMKPIDFNYTNKYPLVISLHGKGGVGSDNIRQLKLWTKILAGKELRKKYPCFVAVPQTPKNWTIAGEKLPEITEENLKKDGAPWKKFLARLIGRTKSHSIKEGAYLQKVFDLLDKIKKEFKIDTARIYVLGHSMGGFGSWNAIWERPEMFAAAIPIAGGLMPWKDPCKFKKMPVWSFHGAADQIIPVFLTQSIFKAIKECKGNMKYTELKGVGHNSQVIGFNYKRDDREKGYITHYSSDKCSRTEDVWDWLFNQKLTK